MPEDFNPEAGANSFDEFLSRYLAGEQARQARSIDLSRFLTARTQGILQQAGRFALERGQTELDALHILRVIAEDDSVEAGRRAHRRRPRAAHHRDRGAPARGIRDR